jgi:predicted transcriptional regulator
MAMTLRTDDELERALDALAAHEGLSRPRGHSPSRARALPPHAAAALPHSLVRNHALVDGNKRLAWLATVVFLDLNGRRVELDDDEAFELVMSAAAGELDVEAIAERLVTTE